MPLTPEEIEEFRLCAPFRKQDLRQVEVLLSDPARVSEAAHLCRIRAMRLDREAQSARRLADLYARIAARVVVVEPA